MFILCEEKTEYFKSQLLMLEDEPGNPVIIVEGTQDEQALDGIFNGVFVPVFDPSTCEDPGFDVESNKDLVIEAARWMKEEMGRKYFIAIVDSDYERIDALRGGCQYEEELRRTEEQRKNIHVFMTDWHDLDVHVFYAVFERFADGRLNAKSYKSFVGGTRYGWVHKLKQKIEDTGIEIGCVRYALHMKRHSQNHIGKSISDTEYIDTNLNVDARRAFSESCVSGDSEEEKDLLTSYRKIGREIKSSTSGSMKDEVKLLVNGHDLFRIMGLCIIACQGDSIGTCKYAESVPKQFREFYNTDDFERSGLYKILASFTSDEMQLFEDN